MKRSNVPDSETEGKHLGRPPSEQATSPTLLARLSAGEQAGWERLVRLYGPLVYSWCRQGGLTREDASDAAQDVFASVSKNFETFRRDRPGDSFRKWLKTVTFNRVRDYHRRRTRRVEARGGTTAQIYLSQLPNPEATTDEGPLDEGPLEESRDEQVREENHLLRKATQLVRDQFEAATWQAFWQTAVEGRSAPDVAADLGLTPNAVRIAKSRVRARLREEMDGFLH